MKRERGMWRVCLPAESRTSENTRTLTTSTFTTLLARNMGKYGAMASKRVKGPGARNQKGKSKAQAPKAAIRNKRQASEDDNDRTSDEDIPVARRRKKSRRALEADEVDDDVDVPNIEVVEDDDSPSEKDDSNKVCCNMIITTKSSTYLDNRKMEMVALKSAILLR